MQLIDVFIGLARSPFNWTILIHLWPFQSWCAFSSTLKNFPGTRWPSLRHFSWKACVGTLQSHYNTAIYSTNSVISRLRLGSHCLYFSCIRSSFYNSILFIIMISQWTPNQCYNEVPVYNCMSLKVRDSLPPSYVNVIEDSQFKWQWIVLSTLQPSHRLIDSDAQCRNESISLT